MSLDSLDLFLQPFFTGLWFALLLPLLGCYLRLRQEWLAALAYAHVAAAGALLAMALSWPLGLGGFAAAGLAALGRRPLAARHGQGTVFALYLLAGWAAAVLLVANLPTAEQLGHALFDGQLYFTDRLQLWIGGLWCLGALLVLRRLSRSLLLGQLFPEFFRARQLPAWPAQVGFDLLAAGSLALGTMTLGVMATFALVFIPPWLAFSRAGNWRRGLLTALLVGVGSYLGVFVAALVFDQAFGPLLVLGLVGVGLVMGSIRSSRSR
ncbi:MAG: hypothetical protein RIR00_1324 [Pseudomonadota bacterium]|jgi:zinc transport system permease protein